MTKIGFERNFRGAAITKIGFARDFSVWQAPDDLAAITKREET
jgi:hypothetical protein